MALYHIHRPQDYNELIGQEFIVTTLKNQIASGRIGHAYLFSGPRGVGKTTTARILAKAVNCVDRTSGDPNPCNTCNSCQEITAGHAIDVMEMDAASHTGVDNVRENIIDNAQFKPTKTRYKIFIIDEVHMLSTSAFNALLKIMEEPPKHVLFILATTELHKVPDTIISRCQRFQFKRVPHAILQEYLLNVAKKEGYTIDKTVLDTLVEKSEGCVRDAISLLDQLMAMGSREISEDTARLILPRVSSEHLLKLTAGFCQKDAKQSLAALSVIVETEDDLLAFCDQLIEFLRELMIFLAYPEYQSTRIKNLENTQHMTTLLQNITGHELLLLLDILLRRRLEIKSSPLPQLPLEMAIIEWCDESTQKKTKELDREPIPVTKENLTPAPRKLVTQNEIEKNWSELMRALEVNSPSLVFILKMAELVGVELNTITLTVPYSFHRDKLMDIKTRMLLEKTLSEQLSTSVALVVLTKETPAEEKKRELDNLASLVGGEVV